MWTYHQSNINKTIIQQYICMHMFIFQRVEVQLGMQTQMCYGYAMKIGNSVSTADLEKHMYGIPGQFATIISCMFPDVTTIPTHTCLCTSLTQMRLQTTTLIPMELKVFCFCLELHTYRQ